MYITKTTLNISFLKQRRHCSFPIVFDSICSQNLTKHIHVFLMIQLGQWTAASKKQMLHCAFGRPDPVKLLTRPLFLFAAEHWRNWIMKKTYVHVLILSFNAFPLYFKGPKNIEIKLGVVRCSASQKLDYFSTIQVISVAAGSIRIRLSHVRLFYEKISALYTWFKIQ